jgi:F-type H+-transporting ATPase subunit gamma
VSVVFSTRHGVVRRRLVPVDTTTIQARPRRWPPRTHLPPARLAERMIEEYVFGELAKALAESFAAENAARLQTMQSARLAVDERLGELELRERRARQEQITDELLELATGAAAALR